MRDLLFRPAFNLADTFSATVAGVLMLNGHWLASLPVVAFGAALSAYGRRRMRPWPAPRIVR
jgi:hypothetical protein